MLVTDDKLVDVMRAFVTASNRLDNLGLRDAPDLRLLEEAAEARRQAGLALQEALVERGWRRPGY